MGEALPEGVSRQEFSDLAAGVKELREAMAELRQARSEPERREARAEVRDAKAELADVAKELGLDPKRLEEAAGQARSADEKERLRPLLIELLDDAKETVKETAPEPPQPDTAPGLGHWSERPLSSLFGGEGK